jgi:crotonobetainyl-CoA:carnitine CoA-transferase CaiB-like acyl-CoA transferase
MVCNLDPNRFVEIFRLIGRPEVAEEYGGVDGNAIEKRSRDLPKLNAIFAEWARDRTAEELQQTLSEMSVPNGVVKQVPELLEDPHLVSRNMVVDIDHAKLGEVKTFNLPIKFFGGEMGIERGENPQDPELGQDSTELLGELLELDHQEVDRLREQKVIWK